MTTRSPAVGVAKEPLLGRDRQRWICEVTTGYPAGKQVIQRGSGTRICQSVRKGSDTRPAARAAPSRCRFAGSRRWLVIGTDNKPARPRRREGHAGSPMARVLTRVTCAVRSRYPEDH